MKVYCLRKFRTTYYKMFGYKVLLISYKGSLSSHLLNMTKLALGLYWAAVCPAPCTFKKDQYYI